jgi:hypothetical protein
MAGQVLIQARIGWLAVLHGCLSGNLNMTYLALPFARYPARENAVQQIFFKRN